VKQSEVIERQRKLALNLPPQSSVYSNALINLPNIRTVYFHSDLSIRCRTQLILTFSRRHCYVQSGAKEERLISSIVQNRENDRRSQCTFIVVVRIEMIQVNDLKSTLRDRMYDVS
jgi:hypothetical protein